MVWKKYNSRIIAVCAVILMLGMTGFFAGCGAEREGTQEEQQGDTAAEQEQQTPAPVVVEPDSTEAGQAGSDAADTSEAGTSGEAEPEYDFGPVSYDLTRLPPMENRMYAAWEGNIYYRQYSDEDLEEGALWGDFAGIPDTVKELMRMEPDGSVTQVGVDYGYAGLFIVNGRIYSQKYKKTREDGQYLSVVYSCALDGSGLREYSAREVLAVRGDKIICWTGGYGEGYGNGGYGMAWIDGQSGEEHILIPRNHENQSVEYLDATEETVYLSKRVENGSEMCAPYDLILCSVDYQGNTKELATVTQQEYVDCLTDDLMQYPLYISCFQIREDELYFSVGSANGNAYMYSGGMIYRVKKDGSGLTRLVDKSIIASFYLYDDGEDKAVFCYLADWEDGMQQVVVQGQAARDIVVRDADQTYYDRPHGYETEGGADAVLFYPDTSGVCYVLLTPEESEKLGIRMYVDGHNVQQIRDIEYLGGKLFFTVTDQTYSKEYSIGWRDGYERGRSVCYCKDMENGEIRALYEY